MRNPTNQKETFRIFEDLARVLAVADDLSDADLEKELRSESMDPEEILRLNCQVFGQQTKADTRERLAANAERFPPRSSNDSQQGKVSLLVENREVKEHRKRARHLRSEYPGLSLAATLLIGIAIGSIPNFLTFFGEPQDVTLQTPTVVSPSLAIPDEASTVANQAPSVAHKVPSVSSKEPAESEIITRGKASELLLFRYQPLGDMLRIDDRYPGLTLGDILHLRVSSSAGKFIYILDIGGNGKAQIYPREAMENVHWGWKIEGPPPTETIILLSSDQELPIDKLTAQISALGVKPKIKEGTQILWRNRAWEIQEGSHVSHGSENIEDLEWTEHILRVLNSVDGMSFNGRTLWVSPEAGEPLLSDHR